MLKTTGIILMLLIGFAFISNLTYSVDAEEYMTVGYGEEGAKMAEMELFIGDIYWIDITISTEPVDIFMFHTVEDAQDHMEGYIAENGMLLGSGITGSDYIEIEITPYDEDNIYFVVWTLSEDAYEESLVTFTEGVSNPLTDDRDGDDIPDIDDAFPDDPNEWLDSDSDGVGDNADAYPNDSTKWEQEADTSSDSDDSPFMPFIVIPLVLLSVAVILRSRKRD